MIVAWSTSVCPFAIICVIFHTYPAFQVIKNWLWLFKTESKSHKSKTAFHFRCVLEFTRVQCTLFLMEFVPDSLHNYAIYLFRMIPLLFLVYCFWQSFTFTVTKGFKSKEDFPHLEWVCLRISCAGLKRILSSSKTQAKILSCPCSTGFGLLEESLKLQNFLAFLMCRSCGAAMNDESPIAILEIGTGEWILGSFYFKLVTFGFVD